MKFIFVIVSIIQITFAQSPLEPGISPEDATALHNAFATLFSDGSIINDFALKIQQRNGLDDQIINNIANIVVKEVSDYITSMATTLPNSAQFIKAVVSAIQEFDVLQELLNKEGYNDSGIFAYVLVKIYNEVVLTLKRMAEPFVSSIRELQGNDIAPPKPTIRPNPVAIANFKASLTKIHQNVMEIAELVESSKLFGGGDQTATSGTIQQINNLIENILTTLDPTIAVNVKDMINDVFEQIITIMDVYEEYKGIDETQIIIQLVRIAYKSAISSFYKLELQAEQLSSDAPSADSIHPPPPSAAIQPVQGIPVGIDQKIQQLKQRTDLDEKSLLSLIKALKEQNGKDNLMFASIFQQILKQFKNLAHSSYANQPALNAQISQIFESIFADLANWDEILRQRNQSIESVLAELLPKILNDIFNSFYAIAIRV